MVLISIDSRESSAGAVQYKCMRSAAARRADQAASGRSTRGALSSKGIYMVHGANAETFTAQYTVDSAALSRPTSRFEIDVSWSNAYLYVNPMATWTKGGQYKTCTKRVIDQQFFVALLLRRAPTVSTVYSSLSNWSWAAILGDLDSQSPYVLTDLRLIFKHSDVARVRLNTLPCMQPMAQSGDIRAGWQRLRIFLANYNRSIKVTREHVNMSCLLFD
jgi:hypothetical protein